MDTDAQTNPFDDESHRFLVLANTEGAYSLWPDFAVVPAGWTAVFGPDERSKCLDHVEHHWADISPANGADDQRH
ncbi:MbtH family protein [Notoacmeibacter ruber]|uniref:MbtH family protein n=1 Tax=Notoacmeibacter ruber TaxID=2670375 RepID=A0A3L7JE21_9HYPH|nr:MbtH family protein [Notoacmeibacter ruber]RLQ88555.1 MbtH family protein [Notoacmeibacter ruber]